ncbi:hypothetical protein ACFL1U_03315 [Patescibacteria group bacterium]
MRNQKKKERYKKKPAKPKAARNVEQEVNTTETVVMSASDDTAVGPLPSQIDRMDDVDVVDDDTNLGYNIVRVGIATLAVAILFGVVGYLAMKTQVIENWSERLLDWFNLV